MENLYFDESRSAAVRSGGDTKKILEAIANHFTGNNPAMPFRFKMDFDNGIICDKAGRYQFDFDRRFPEAEIENGCVAYGKLWSHEDRKSGFVIRCIGPTAGWVNGEAVFKSQPGQETGRAEVVIDTTLKKGWNYFWFYTEKTEAGFGFEFGNRMPQWDPCLFDSPLPEREGEMGWVYSGPLDECPGVEEMEGIAWYPRDTQNGCHEEGCHSFACPSEVFGEAWSGVSYAKAAVVMKRKGTFSVNGISGVKADVILDGRVADCGQPFELEKGEHTVLIRFEKSAEKERERICFEVKGGCIGQPVPVRGYRGVWLYLGPFSPASEPEIPELLEMNRIYRDGAVTRYWQTDVSHGVVRMCVEEQLYGRWTYPMGVTLYGLLKTSDYLEKNDYREYTKKYVEQITACHEYALFDRERFGFPAVNHQICWLTELDDCGSFGSLMLECRKRWENPSADQMAEIIADHMMNRQRRRPDGVFCRGDDTMWIDDLYMSVPFLVRYSQLTGDGKYLDEACRQMMLFKRYFFMEDKMLMSHIYDMRREKANRIPWSRGNGWVLFSLSELLAVLPESHKQYGEILTFFNEMASGIRKVQGVHGLWHQVLDDPTTYEESSSTAMFICALTRGIKNRYGDETTRKVWKEMAESAWNGLIKYAVDGDGNVYGVCQGSGCSFSRRYYRNLSWKYNDPHGIGIVLMAGVEMSLCLEEEES